MAAAQVLNGILLAVVVVLAYRLYQYRRPDDRPMDVDQVCERVDRLAEIVARRRAAVQLVDDIDVCADGQVQRAFTLSWRPAVGDPAEFQMVERGDNGRLLRLAEGELEAAEVELMEAVRRLREL